MTKLINIEEAKLLVQQGQVIAYPTEGVYGLGCDPFQKNAVLSLLKLKQRSASQGLILLIANWEQLYPLIQPLTDVQMQRLQQTWPGFITWILPKSNLIPSWVSGKHDSIAIRMTTHSVAKSLCETNAIISTSANVSGQPAAKTWADVQKYFPQGLGGIVSGEIGKEKKASPIFDLNGTIIRG